MSLFFPLFAIIFIVIVVIVVEVVVEVVAATQWLYLFICFPLVMCCNLFTSDVIFVYIPTYIPTSASCLHW